MVKTCIGVFAAKRPVKKTWGKPKKTKENMFFLVFVLFLDCFSNWHLSARFQKQIKQIFFNILNFRSKKTRSRIIRFQFRALSFHASPMRTIF